VSAAPVVDTRDTVLGMVSEADLVQPYPGERDDEDLISVAAADLAAASGTIRSKTHKVADVMTREVVVAAEDTPLSELARLMTDHAVKCLPIVRNGKVVGIVSRTDVLRALVALDPNRDKDTAKFSRDERLRREIAAACRGRSWSKANGVDVLVDHGVAHLWGIAPSEMVRRAYRAAAENVPGVKAVEVHMHIVPPPALRVGL
jgi:Mg/Co/Ni transporter MgtE